MSITIYTIGINDSAKQADYSILKAMASSASNFQDVNDSRQLEDFFDRIATEVSCRPGLA